MPTGYAALLAEINKLEQLLGDIERVNSRGDQERKRELIGLRRLMSTQIGTVRATGDAAFPTTDATALAVDYRARFSAMVRAIALHQANWPAVKMDEKGDGYRASASATDARIHDFITWTRSSIAGFR